MIYLIGGVSKTGKSYIARKLMTEYKLPFFSTDFLLWSLGGKTKEDGMFSYFDTDEEVSPIVEPYLLKIIYFLNRNNQNYVFEGTHLTVSLAKKLEKMYPGKVKSVFLGYTKVSVKSKIEEVYKYESDESNKWYQFLSEEEFEKFIAGQIEKSKSLKIKCQENELTFYDIIDIKDDETKIISSLLGM